MNESTGSNTPHRNPHQQLLANVKHSLAECSSGDRTLLFETRERLHELTALVEHGPWGILSSLTGTVEMMLGHLLRRGSLEGPELMQVATDLISFVEQVLATTPPEGTPAPASIPGLPRAQRLVLDGPAPEGNLKFVRPSLRHDPLTAVDGELVAGASDAGSPASARGEAYPQGSPEAGEAPDLDAESGGKRTAADFGRVAYQMVNESRLGELLIKMGQLQPAQLDRALVLQKLSRKRLGDVLMAMEAVDLQALQTALEVQRQETLRFTGGGGGARPGSDVPFGRAS